MIPEKCLHTLVVIWNRLKNFFRSTQVNSSLHFDHFFEHFEDFYRFYEEFCKNAQKSDQNEETS